MAGTALGSPVDVLLGALTGGGGGGALFCGVGGAMAELEPGTGGTRLERCTEATALFGDVGEVSAEGA